MPIFKDFIKNAVIKKDARPFKVPKNITMMVIDPITGKKASFGSKETIIEADNQLKESKEHYTNDGGANENVTEVKSSATRYDTIQSNQRKQVDGDTLAKRWAISSVRACATIRKTTQQGVGSTLYPTLF